MKYRDLIWDNLVLPDATLAKLKRAASGWQNWERLQELRSPLTRGLLIYGRPGTGTSRAARTLARESGCFVIDPGISASLKGGWIGETQKSIRELFERAQGHVPCIVSLDAIDYLAPPRSYEQADYSTNESASELVMQIDGVQGRGRPGGFLLCTAYGADKVDPAIVTRLATIEIPFPSVEERRRLFREALTACEIPLDDDLDPMIDELAACTEGTNPRGVEFMARAGQRAWALATERGEKPATIMREEMVRELSSAMKFSC